MVEEPTSHIRTDGPLGSRGATTVLRFCAWLTLAVLVFSVPIAWVADARHGSWGLAATAVAGGVCWLGAVLALWITWQFSGAGPVAVQGVLLGMLFRMGLPLAAGVALTTSGGALAQAGVFGLILAFYLLTLPLETWLSVRLVSSQVSAGAVSAGSVSAGKVSRQASKGSQ